jgi:hypothetical protein
MVREVFVNGRHVVAGGRVVAWDEDRLLTDVRASTAGAWARFGAYHNGPEPIDVAYPAAFAPWRGS